MIALIDYGMGNIHSVKKALELCGAQVLVTNKLKDISSCDKIVLPGVGAFDDAVSELEKEDLIPIIKSQVSSGKYFLGVCLGMQLLFEDSEEAKTKKGLGIIKGRVKKFPKGKFKVPHMGWNQIEKVKEDCGLLKGIEDGACFYFCHSYYPLPFDKDVVAATCDYGAGFASVVNRDNVYGVQFHPEKSQDVGLKVIKNFVKLC
jgi:glutamine amidotransferase